MTPRQPISPLAVSLGDPAGIGPEVIAKCWDNRRALGLPDNWDPMGAVVIGAPAGPLPPRIPRDHRRFVVER